MRVIGFLSDYGSRDPYVGEVKAVLIGRCPDAIVIDITHEVDPFNVLQGAFLLRTAYRFFPKGSIFLAVVDPGVGTERRGVVIKTKNYWFVGPDNGLLYPSAVEDGIEECFEVQLSGYARYGCETFHGRDVFAPVVCELHSGLTPHVRPLDPKELVTLELEGPKSSEREVIARVLHVDRFGNCITNVGLSSLPPWMEFGSRYKVSVGSRTIEASLVRAYGIVGSGDFLLTLGGTGYLELSVNRGSAASELGVKAGDVLKIKRTA
ncbi:MAG: SAM-dependent chlorinase/fluorinase [Thaumarchaeota archaeon]|nr:SAM-dependent chlorinase/fluorinase [Candidatus Calditenuaceae archaeon]MDW8186651.1 SAM-dependent chlorinase/fluorinase [Nitrososphaerota archaeon]